MEADTRALQRIDGAAQPDEPGVSCRRPRGGGGPAVRRLSCDGIWAEWSTAGAQPAASAGRRCLFSVGTGRRQGTPGKLGAALVALTAAALLGAGSALPSPAHAQELPKVSIAAGLASHPELTFEVRAVDDIGPGIAARGVATPPVSAATRGLHAYESVLEPTTAQVVLELRVHERERGTHDIMDHPPGRQPRSIAARTIRAHAFASEPASWWESGICKCRQTSGSFVG